MAHRFGFARGENSLEQKILAAYRYRPYNSFQNFDERKKKGLSV
jgi:hypothetical protein